jgi:hypothetical protein
LNVFIDIHFSPRALVFARYLGIPRGVDKVRGRAQTGLYDTGCI